MVQYKEDYHLSQCHLKKKLTKFGIEGRMLGWIQDFLDGRKIRVRVADEHSEYVGYENGSP